MNRHHYVFCRYLHTVRCPHTVTVYDVLQVAQTKCRMSEQSGNKILGKQNPNFTGSHTRQTSLKTNYSIRDDSSETSQGQHAKQTRASDAQQGEISPVNRGGSSRFSDRCINRKCEVTIGTVGATERRRREHLGGSGGMHPQENFEI